MGGEAGDKTEGCLAEHYYSPSVPRGRRGAGILALVGRIRFGV